MKKALKFAIIAAIAVLIGSTPQSIAQNYNAGIGAVRFRSGPTVPATCPMDGHFFWKNVSPKGWYICNANVYVPFAQTSLTNILTGAGACGATCVGTGADLVMYTYTLPGGTLLAGKGIRFKARWICSTCTAAGKVFRWTFGGTTLSNPSLSASTTNQDYQVFEVYNNPGSTTAQTALTDNINFGTAESAAQSATPAENTANNITVTFVFNAAATETMTPVRFTAELIP